MAKEQTHRCYEKRATTILAKLFVRGVAEMVRWRISKRRGHSTYAEHLAFLRLLHSIKNKICKMCITD
jgi:hypothetical protein